MDWKKLLLVPVAGSGCTGCDVLAACVFGLVVPGISTLAGVIDSATRQCIEPGASETAVHSSICFTANPVSQRVSQTQTHVKHVVSFVTSLSRCLRHACTGKSRASGMGMQNMWEVSETLVWDQAGQKA